MQFYGLKNCDTCKKAQKALVDAGLSFEVVDVRADGVPADALASWVATLGADALVNRRSSTWRRLGDAEKASAEGQGAVDLMLANPTLMKRPVIVTDGALHVGWTKDVQAALL